MKGAFYPSREKQKQNRGKKISKKISNSPFKSNEPKWEEKDEKRGKKSFENTKTLQKSEH